MRQLNETLSTEAYFAVSSCSVKSLSTLIFKTNFQVIFNFLLTHDYAFQGLCLNPSEFLITPLNPLNTF